MQKTKKKKRYTLKWDVNPYGYYDVPWSPVIGCFMKCQMCIAKANNDKFRYIKKFNTLEFFPGKLGLTTARKKPTKFIVTANTDPAFWHEDWIEAILDECRANPRHTYLFQTRLVSSFLNIDFPANVKLGLTVTGEPGDSLKIKDFSERYSNYRLFLSIEPLLGGFDDHRVLYYNKYELFVIGAMVGNGAPKPKQEWVTFLKDNLPAERVIWKNNLKKMAQI